MDEHLIMTIWDMFREYIPEKNREMAANQYVDFLLGNDIDVDTLQSYTGYDPHLDEAIKSVTDEEESFEEEDDGYRYDEDEDY
jgi:hypothetical protein